LFTQFAWWHLGLLSGGTMVTGCWGSCRERHQILAADRCPIWLNTELYGWKCRLADNQSRRRRWPCWGWGGGGGRPEWWQIGWGRVWGRPITWRAICSLPVGWLTRCSVAATKCGGCGTPIPISISSSCPCC
jgi:hypothetical protein